MQPTARLTLVYVALWMAAEFAGPLPLGAQAQNYDQLILQALAAYDAGRWDEARRLFEAAHAIDPTARTLRTIGMAAFNQGDHVAALLNLEAALVDPRKPLTEAQRVHVSQLIESANREVGRFRLQVLPPAARVLVDGRPPAFARSGELLLPPGQHSLRADAKGHTRLEKALEVRAGDRGLVVLEMQAEAASADATGTVWVPPAAAAVSPQTEPVSTRRTWALIALCAGGAGLLTSAITLGFALGDEADLNRACPQRKCEPPQHHQVERYDTLRSVSGIALASGLVGAGIGSYLLLASGGDEHGPRVEALIAPTLIGIRGRL